MSLQEEIVDELTLLTVRASSQMPMTSHLPSVAQSFVNQICNACIQAITDNPHKSPIEAITDMRRKG